MRRWGLHDLPYIVAATVLIWTLAGPGYGADATWVHDPNTAGDWYDPNNWDPNAPGAADTALIDNGGTASIASGSVEVNELRAGVLYAGSVDQSGGTHAAGWLYLGYEPASSGMYNLSEGSLRTGASQFVGYYGTGAFNQSSGTGTARYVFLGYKPGSSGMYSLNGGSLGTEWSQYVAVYGRGTFSQSDGTNTVGDSLYLGYYANSSGTYELSNGLLDSLAQYVGRYGTGAFLQSGGMNVVEGSLYLGYSAGARGTYNLSEGLLGGAEAECVGYYGTGTFLQSGGTNTVWGQGICLGYNPGSSGMYTLSEGSLEAAYQYVGLYGTGTFSQSGGTNTVGQTLCLGTDANASGTYNLSEGLMTVGGNVIVGGDGNARGILNITGGSLVADGQIMLALGTFSTAKLKVGKDAYVQAGGLTIDSGGGQSTQVAMEIDANGNSLINTTGSSSLAGLLDIQSLNSFRPNQGDTFTLIASTGGTISDNFGSITSNIQGWLRADRDVPIDPNDLNTYRPVFSGAVVDANYVVTFQGAREGDATGDNRVDTGDLSMMGGAWLVPGGTFTWLEGDFNGDGVVNTGDLSLMGENWLWEGAWPGPPPLGASNPSAPLPEPASLAMLSLGSLGLLRRRKTT